VHHAINLLREEVDRDMALLGITELAQMTRERLVKSPERPSS
jgi:isopentenyl diphosphate isomerase/L-lactate dehydrogenase-like FMN-dependent dehydrogenase